MIDHYHSVQAIETRVFSPTTTTLLHADNSPTDNGPTNSSSTAPKRRRLGGRTSSFSKKD